MSISFTNPLSLPVLGFCAYSGTGKTTLLKKLIPELNRRGVRMAVVKHAHHNFDVDIPGKDSYEMRKAGAKQMLVASHVRWALMTEDAREGDPELPHLLKQLDTDNIDIVLVEGFKKLTLPKIELHRAAHGKPFIYQQDDNIQAIACCDDTVLPAELTRLDINNVEQIADYVQQYISQWRPQITHIPLAEVPACELDSSSSLTVRQGIDHILNQVQPITATDAVSLDQLDNRVLAADAISPINVPQQNNSAMDGYGFAFSDPLPTEFTLVGEVLAGHSYDKQVLAGEAVRIMTGAPVPAGVDTVQPRELAHEQAGKVSLEGKIKQGQNVRQAGEDIAKGAAAINQGQRIGVAAQGLLASLGMAQFDVYRRPKVAVFSSGDEVCQPGEALKSSCIFDANRYSIKAMLRRLGAEVIDLGIIEDSEAALAQALLTGASQADMVISSGGVSVGDADYIKTALAKVGEINFWRINMRPGRPLAFGKINDCLFFGLPGNPVAVMVSLLQFVQPALRKLAGEQAWQPQLIAAIADQPLRSRSGRTEFIRGIYHLGQDGRVHVRSTGAQGSGMLSSMVQANCLIVIADDNANINAGEIAYIQPFADLV
ncbi:bifunctional molybdopterin-guanine dinucleotide biosynthesis adaptor protein MobB/molybdopterin molybdotransferase MoeA [Shewanella marina]|uniref:bifunctional molybdopterin-guanine dinucleotide biosynthesis adaptor protein MobB/molybdopterin molybdotransferase MoeA n=1 Tax=Shewanella marina TaxID=487319 RepID=UPI0004726462|nr:bifunctional molybdopterin-guanine dinucleotide biosynthesis adaptor protein MobB/molybdopterin molybdotransferase MoeA [Shewanella marina]